MKFLNYIDNKDIISEAFQSVNESIDGGDIAIGAGAYMAFEYQRAMNRLVNNIKLRNYIIKSANVIIKQLKKEYPSIDEDINPSIFNMVVNSFKIPKDSVNDRTSLFNRYFSMRIYGSERVGRILGNHNYYIFFDSTHIEEIWIIMNNKRNPLYEKIKCPKDKEINKDFFEVEK